MKNPRTIYDVLQMLEGFHQQRHSVYQRLSSKTNDSQARILLEHLVELEDHSLKATQQEMGQLDSDHATWMTSGPVISDRAIHAQDCQCGDSPTFQEALDCVFSSNQRLEELIQRLEGGSASPSVQKLAQRLRELEEIKARQIANFTRLD